MIFFFVFCLFWLTSYYVVGIHAYCVVRTINWAERVAQRLPRELFLPGGTIN